MTSLMNLVDINYNLKRYIKSSNVEQLDAFKSISSQKVLNCVYIHLNGECEGVKTTCACISILVDCTFLDIEIDIKIIPRLLELYKYSSYQSEMDILFQNLFVDKLYTHHLLENTNFIDICLPIYIHRGLNKLNMCIKSYGTMKMDNDTMSLLLDFVYIYILNHSFNEKTKDIFHDCLYVLVNAAYSNYIQPEFIALVTNLYDNSYYIETKYLILNYMYNVYHDALYKKYLVYNIYLRLMQDFIKCGGNKYPSFCKILENEI